MTETYETAAFERLARIEDHSFWFRARNKLVFWMLDRWCAEARSFLEVGCGTGYVLAGIHQHRPDLELQAVEPYDEGIAVAHARLPDVEILRVEAEAMEFEGEFDVVGTFDVLEHIPDDEAALKGISRALRPDGILLVAVPQHPWLWSAADDFAHHQRRYRRAELVDKVERAGFEVLTCGSFMAVTLPLMVASRLAYKVRPSRRDDPLGDLELPSVINRVLGWALAFERGLIKLGVRFPAGGSCFLVGRRAGAGQVEPGA